MRAMARKPGVVFQSKAAAPAVSGAQPAGHSIFELQRSVGNRAVGELLRADPDGFTAGSMASASREVDLASLVRNVLHSSGDPLDRQARAALEPGFQQDFSNVRVHTGPDAAASARAVNALAYTLGSDIVFASGQYSPNTQDGLKLLAHELTHVVQQGKSTPLARKLHRATADMVPSQEGESTSTDRLLELASHVEAVQERAEQENPGSGTALGQLAGRVRTAANSGNEKLKARVLEAFSAEHVELAKQRLRTSPDFSVTESQPESVATRSLEVSQPQDASELEAERVANAVVSGSRPAVTPGLADSVLSRTDGVAVMEAGELLLGLEAEAAPEEVVAGPPGWIVGGLVLLAAGVLIGTGYLMSRGRGNVADTGIMGEVQGIIAAGVAATVCAALALLLDQARQAGDTERARRIQTTQKAKGCRHSRDV
jgi:hypothetical protein